MQFSELEFGGVHDLVVAGMPGSAFHVNGADKKVEPSGEGEYDIRIRRCDFGLDIGEASGGKKNANAVANLIPVEGWPDFCGSISSRWAESAMPGSSTDLTVRPT